MPRLIANAVLAAAAMFAVHADAETLSCPPVTSSPGTVRAIVDGRRSPVGVVKITYSFVEKSVCAAFTANPKTAKTIQPETICYDVSFYGRLTQRGNAVATATMLDGSQRELRLDHESEINLSFAYAAYTNDCLGIGPDAPKPSL